MATFIASAPIALRMTRRTLESHRLWPAASQLTGPSRVVRGRDGSRRRPGRPQRAGGRRPLRSRRSCSRRTASRHLPHARTDTFPLRGLRRPRLRHHGRRPDNPRRPHHARRPQPRTGTAPAGGNTVNTPATTMTTYYSAGTNSTYPECGSHPEWADLVSTRVRIRWERAFPCTRGRAAAAHLARAGVPDAPTVRRLPVLTLNANN
jgi:hypothetical protein